MSASQIVPFIRSVFQRGHGKRQATLATLVSALVTVGKVGVAALGHGIRSKVAHKHRIKQVDRFLGNRKLHVDDWCEDLLGAVLGARRAVTIAIDWTKVGLWPVLVASVVVRRRGVPVYWATCDWHTLARSQNAFEEAFLLRLRLMIPRDVDVTLLFDRGFRRVELARFLKRHGFHFVVRCCGDTHIDGADYKGALEAMPLRRGVLRDLGRVLATKDRPEEVRLVAIFDHGQKDAWYLFTDLDLPPDRVVKAYGRRFTIEEVFRDGKSTRYGWSLGEYRLKDRPDRLDRLILVLAAAYLLVTQVGLAIEAKGFQRKYKANTSKARTHSLFQLGWKGHDLVRWLPRSWRALFDRLDFDLVSWAVEYAVAR